MFPWTGHKRTENKQLNCIVQFTVKKETQFVSVEMQIHLREIIFFSK